MKKLNLLIGILIGMFIVFSCSNDNETDPNIETDLIIGVWKLSRSVDFYNNMTEEFIATECSQQSRQVFESNGNYSFTDYNTPQNECVNGYFSTSGTWTNNNSTYEITFTFECLGTDCDDDTIPEITLIDENTLRIQYNGELINGTLTEYFFREYIRI